MCVCRLNDYGKDLEIVDELQKQQAALARAPKSSKARALSARETADEMVTAAAAHTAPPPPPQAHTCRTTYPTRLLAGSVVL